MPQQQEVWLSGSIEGVPAPLQPVAHALLQAKEEVGTIVADLPAGMLWYRPAGLASAAFHLQHLRGVIDRLFTYAAGALLSEKQLSELRAEGKENKDIDKNILLADFQAQVDRSIEMLKKQDTASLYDFRGVGRSQLPSTVIGLLFHAAEHTMRHLGQLLVTARVLKAKSEGKEI